MSKGKPFYPHLLDDIALFIRLNPDKPVHDIASLIAVYNTTPILAVYEKLDELYPSDELKRRLEVCKKRYNNMPNI